LNRFRVFPAALPFLAVCFGIAAGGSASGQCLLANPSFEIGGSGGRLFGGWNQFGVVASSPTAAHGAVAARVSGPNSGGWDVSAVWQPLDAAPGDVWRTSVTVRHTSAHPLTGSCLAIVNVEWRDSGGNLISYESFTAAGAGDPADASRRVTFTTGAAPSGTAAARLLLGVLQSPTDPPPDVIYDEAIFEKTVPDLDAVQWNDFPGGRTLSFGGRTWRVKGPGYYGPGPNLFSDGPGNVWVDANGKLHMTVRNVSGAWYSTEITLQDTLGYGDYVFTTEGRLDQIDSLVVLGLFLWEYGACYDPAYLWWNPYNEIDVEYSRWADSSNDIGQFVAQPYDWPGNIDRFAAAFSPGEITSHAFRWLPDRVEYRSWRGGPNDEGTSAPIHSWTYSGPHIPRPGRARVHINLWRITGNPASNQEVILPAFTFVPEHPLSAAPGPGGEALARIPALFPASPNPFRASTTIRWRMAEPGPADLAVFDVAGRRVRSLRAGPADAGLHELTWDGKDDDGRRVAANLYFVRLAAGDAVEARRVVVE